MTIAGRCNDGNDNAVVTTTSCKPIKSVECPVGYSHIHGHCYKYFQNAMRYWDASKTCENNGGYLVIITDETALTDVLDFAKDAKSWWIGLHIVKNKGSGKPTINDFRWSDGTKPNYTDWTYTFPRDITRYGSCVRMLGNTGGWENRHCLRYRLPFVCESPGIVVTPTTITPTISPSDVCPSEMYYLDGGEIYSPGYPLGYASHMTCMYELVCHIGETIKLEFEDLNLSGNSTITLRHMNGEQTVVDYVIDMNTAERKFNTTVSNVMYVEFRSGPAGGSWMFRWSKQTDESITCPPSYIGHNGYCYKFDRTPLTYSMATMACMRDNAFIASIGGVQENEYVNLLGGESDALWIGLKIGDQSVWADKSDSKYRNWMEGYPKPKTYYGSCVRMNIIKNGKWQNVPCEWIQLPFVCKKQGVPKTMQPVLSTLSPRNECPQKQIYYDKSEVESPGWPSNYSSGLSCEYVFISPIDHIVLLTFETIELSPNDVIELYEEFTDGHLALRATIKQGEQQKVFSTEKSNVLLMRMKSAKDSQFGGKWRLYQETRDQYYITPLLAHQQHQNKEHHNEVTNDKRDQTWTTRISEQLSSSYWTTSNPQPEVVPTSDVPNSDVLLKNPHNFPKKGSMPAETNNINENKGQPGLATPTVRLADTDTMYGGDLQRTTFAYEPSSTTNEGVHMSVLDDSDEVLSNSVSDNAKDEKSEELSTVLPEWHSVPEGFSEFGKELTNPVQGHRIEEYNNNDQILQDTLDDEEFSQREDTGTEDGDDRDDSDRYDEISEPHETDVIAVPQDMLGDDQLAYESIASDDDVN